MILGLCIKKENTYNYCKPFILNKSGEDSFIGQILRDIDFSIFVSSNDSLDLYIIIYPNKDSFYDANKNNIDPNLFKILGNYPIILDNLDKLIIYHDINKGFFNKLLDINNNIEIEFSIIYHKKNESYILSTPCIKGNLKYLK